MNSIIEYLEHWAAVQPDKCFASFLNVSGESEETYTYLGFHQRTIVLADYLSREVGLKRGQRVLLVYHPGLEVIAAFFACARIGLLSVPVFPPTRVNFEGGLRRLKFVARDCQAALALTTASFYQSYRQLIHERVSSTSQDTSALLKLRWVTTDKVRGKASTAFRSDENPNLFLQYTSGSTKEPKGVIVSHQNVIHNARSTVQTSDGVAVSWLPHYHDMGLIGYYLCPTISGGTVYGFSPLDFLKRPILWLQTISRVQATHSSAPNFGFEYCLREDKVPSRQLGELDLSSLRMLMNAAEPVDVNTYVRFLQRFAPYGLRPEAHVAAYGLAESTLAVTNFGTRIMTVNKRLFQGGMLRIEKTRQALDGQIRLASCGQPLAGIHVRIVNPTTRAAVGERQIGEIWIAGKSTCKGYWRRPQLTREVFCNTVANDPKDHNNYLRSGDLGFLHDNELFVCGRIKDLIIIRGINYYPRDIEAVAESASQRIRRGGVVAFGGNQQGENLVVVAEVTNSKNLPDVTEVARAIRTQSGVTPDTIAFVPRGIIARTTSGKIARSLTRERWLNGELLAISIHRMAEEGAAKHGSDLRERFHYIFQRYTLTGREDCTFAEIGMDSLSLVDLMAEIERLLDEHGASELAKKMDGRLIQRLTIAQFFSMLNQFEKGSNEGLTALRSILTQIEQEHDSYEHDHMRSDAQLEEIRRIEVLTKAERVSNVLLTGSTGFFGPFLLSSFLRGTPYTYYVLARDTDSASGMARIRAALHAARVWNPALDREMERRVHVLCGDVADYNLGLRSQQWKWLSTRVQAVFHNAALVNYVLNYDALKPHNVDGTRELLRFSYTGIQKEFHFISSTIIFGWTVKRMLLETDNNDRMENLDFGYAQSKWVAEQLVFAAEKQGLKVRVYRPSFLSASSGGAWSRDDIAMLLLAFMINHAVAVNSRNQISFVPVDIAADNIAAIFYQQQTRGHTMHVTVDHYYNIMDITRLITREYGYSFVYYDIPSFVAEIRRRCTKNDRLYPLVEFFNRSHPRIAAMQQKRYNNNQYREARQLSSNARGDPQLKDTVSYLMTYMLREGFIQPLP
jgi:thioester reductase-like protein